MRLTQEGIFKHVGVSSFKMNKGRDVIIILIILSFGYRFDDSVAKVQRIESIPTLTEALVRNDSIGQGSQEASDGYYCPNVTRH